MVRTSVIGAGTLGIKIAGKQVYFYFLCSKIIFNFFAGYLAYRGHEVRIFDSNSAVLNTVNQRISEDARIFKEDGIMANVKFLVCKIAKSVTLLNNNKLTLCTGRHILVQQTGGRRTGSSVHLWVHTRRLDTQKGNVQTYVLPNHLTIANERNHLESFQKSHSIAMREPFWQRIRCASQWRKYLKTLTAQM